MRAALYARVSSEEQVEGYSIDAQKRAFQALVVGRGWTEYQQYVDEGKSARTDDINRRPAFKEMTAAAVSGNFDVLVVHKPDRFSRNLRITLEYFDKLSKAGIAFVSINKQMDFSTPWGRLALTLLGGLAQFYSDNLSQETKKEWHEMAKGLILKIGDRTARGHNRDQPCLSPVPGGERPASDLRVELNRLGVRLERGIDKAPH